MQRRLVILGLVIITAGILWPWLAKIPLFHLPGDIVVEREGFRFYFPITTGILISILLSLIFWLLRK